MGLSFMDSLNETMNSIFSMFEPKITQIEILKIKNLFAKLRMDFGTIEAMINLITQKSPNKSNLKSTDNCTSKTKSKVSLNNFLVENKSAPSSASEKRCK